MPHRDYELVVTFDLGTERTESEDSGKRVSVGCGSSSGDWKSKSELMYESKSIIKLKYNYYIVLLKY